MRIVTGLVEPLETYEPIAANVVPYVKMFNKMDSRKFSLLTNLRVLLAKPGWIVGTDKE
jgi:hypothetical protein